MLALGDPPVVRLVAVCLGGAVGSGARYLLSGWVLNRAGSGFPWGTLMVNLIGSFLLAALMQVGVSTDILSPILRLALATGVMGGFTTYSTFNYETIEYLRSSAWHLAAANLAVTAVGCLLAGALGFVSSRWLIGG